MPVAMLDVHIAPPGTVSGRRITSLDRMFEAALDRLEWLSTEFSPQKIRTGRTKTRPNGDITG